MLWCVRQKPRKFSSEKIFFRAIKQESLRHEPKEKNLKNANPNQIANNAARRKRKTEKSRHMKMKAMSKNSVRDYHEKEQEKKKEFSTF